MGALISKLTFTGEVLRSILAYIIFGWSKTAYMGHLTEEDAEIVWPYKFLSDKVIVEALSKLLKERGALEKLSDDALAKICRQLEFFYTEEAMVGELDMVALAESLIVQSTWYLPLVDESSPLPPSDLLKLKVPKVRFGKTEIDMPVLTCGGMRIQNSWFPDSIPVLSPNRKAVLESTPQQNLKDCIRYCLALGINHFETARMYGSSEYQMVEALYEMIETGEIKREDFIFQTKIILQKSEKGFKTLWDQTWKNCEKLGHIDLFSLHASE